MVDSIRDRSSTLILSKEGEIMDALESAIDEAETYKEKVKIYTPNELSQFRSNVNRSNLSFICLDHEQFLEQLALEEELDLLPKGPPKEKPKKNKSPENTPSNEPQSPQRNENNARGAGRGFIGQGNRGKLPERGSNISIGGFKRGAPRGAPNDRGGNPASRGGPNDRATHQRGGPAPRGSVFIRRETNGAATPPCRLDSPERNRELSNLINSNANFEGDKEDYLNLDYLDSPGSV